MKYNKKPLTGYLIALLIAGMAISCSREQFLEPVQTASSAADLQIKVINEENYHGEIVPLELAKLVAQKTEFQQLYGGIDSTKGVRGARVATSAKVIREAISLSDKHNQPALHVINYQNGGFVIMSAERSALPVLAFSDDKSFQTGAIPDVIKMWMDGTKASLEQLRTENKPSLRMGVRESGVRWDDVLAITGLLGERASANARGPVDPICPRCEPEPNPDPCNQFWLSEQRGPYIVTNWNQSGGYNWFGHHYNYFCPVASGGPDGKALAGCGAVAGAQLIRFHQYPYSFTYANMANSNATLENARLIREVGRVAGSIYRAHATSTKSKNLAQALRNFGYRSVTHYDSYNTATLIMALNGVPVILRGEGADEEGHLWICDGFKKINSNCATSVTYYWHMNWGWGGDKNGYYSDWGGKLEVDTQSGNPGHNVFGAGRRMITARP